MGISMDEKRQAELKERYNGAVDSFVEKIKDDPNVIAVIVSGSLAYDMIWEKSDIDMTLVVRDQNLKNDSYSIIEDGITINVYITARSSFKRYLERNIGGSFMQAYFSKGRIVYTTDESLYDFFEDIKVMGSDDIALSAFYMASELIGIYDKCQKWLTAREDPLYTQYYILKAAEVIANMELCLAGIPASRESIQKAVALNPGLMKTFYQEAMSRFYSVGELEAAIDKMDAYLMSRLDIIQKPVIEFMSDNEIKTGTLIAKHFHVDSHYIIDVFDYLADKGVIERVSQTIRITPKSKLAVEEQGFLQEQ